MYRQVLIPTEHYHIIPVTMPREWYGKKVEIIAFPMEFVSRKNKNSTKKDITKYFGAWKSDKSAEEIIADIQNSRTSGKTRILEEI